MKLESACKAMVMKEEVYYFLFDEKQSVKIESINDKGTATLSDKTVCSVDILMGIYDVQRHEKNLAEEKRRTKLLAESEDVIEGIWEASPEIFQFLEKLPLLTVVNSKNMKKKYRIIGIDSSGVLLLYPEDISYDFYLDEIIKIRKSDIAAITYAYDSADCLIKQFAEQTISFEIEYPES